ncbi:MAG: histidine triad nucleotide-binding protein [Desulfuromonadales bacterium]|jgi:histidine triad (HIT) family protein
MADNCIFCKIIAGEAPGKIVYQDEVLVALEDINPQAPYHFLLVPRKHIRTTLDLTTADNEILGRLFQVAGKLAHDLDFAEDGFRLVNNCNEGAGQSVWHLHFHLLGGRDLTWPPG